MVKDTSIASEQKQLKTECELIWVKIEMATTKPLYVAAYYKPLDGDAKSAAELRKSLELANSLKGNTWLLGDFNYQCSRKLTKPYRTFGQTGSESLSDRRKFCLTEKKSRFEEINDFKA